MVNKSMSLRNRLLHFGAALSPFCPRIFMEGRKLAAPFCNVVIERHSLYRSKTSRVSCPLIPMAIVQERRLRTMLRTKLLRKS